jgi:hypothetical protein
MLADINQLALPSQHHNQSIGSTAQPTPQMLATLITQTELLLHPMHSVNLWILAPVW